MRETSNAKIEPVATGSTGSNWWRSAVIYQVYPKSFSDSDGDGVGDLPGITSRLDYLVELGVDAVWLSPFYPSPQVDGGYDVADYRDIDPQFGTLDNFGDMLEKSHRLGLRVVLDIVANHTSDQHAWFQAALSAEPGSPQRDRYIFRDGKGESGTEPPNNWMSVFGGPAWTRVKTADGAPEQWYLHMFDPRQADLNYRNAAVRAEFAEVLRFWLDRGVDGLRVDVAHGVMKAEGLPDWSGVTRMIDGDTSLEPDSQLDKNSGPMWDQDEVHEVWREWRAVLNEYDGDRMMVAEAWVPDHERLAMYVRDDEFNQAFNFQFLEAPWTAASIRDAVSQSLYASDAVGAPATWVGFFPTMTSSDTRPDWDCRCLAETRRESLRPTPNRTRNWDCAEHGPPPS